jgi:CheY-like chemotaxis protein
VTTILVVDDEPHIRKVVDLVLSEAGYQVVTAANGVEALECMRQQPPDGVLLDLVMPIMDGRAFLGACRADPAYRTLPVALFTTLGSDAVTLDVQACVPKPFELEELTATVGRMVGQAATAPAQALALRPAAALTLSVSETVSELEPPQPRWEVVSTETAAARLAQRARCTRQAIRRNCALVQASSACLRQAVARLRYAHDQRQQRSAPGVSSPALPAG